MSCLFCKGQVPPPGATCRTCGRKSPEPVNGHECHADGCKVQVPPRMLMCLRHWRMVPRETQRRIWQHYVKGQEIKKNPTRAYLEVMREAIAIVARKEGRAA